MDDVKTTAEVNSHLASPSTSAQSTLFAIPDQVSDDITFLSYAHKNFDLLKLAIETCRVTKSDYEVALLRKANAISTAAHVAVMKAARSATNETQLEAVFLKACLERGAKNQSYHSIVAAGENAATLHYTPNDAAISSQNLLLLDAGCEWDNYCADITRTFPLRGTFSPESRAIYDLVLSMQTQTLRALKAGVAWEDVHVLAHRVLAAGLLALGILRGGTVDEILAARTSVAFMPHGLGHHLGMDTHDTGGNPDYADADPLFKYLRVRGTVPARAVVTVEPGCYFCRFIVEPYLRDAVHARFIDEAVLARYWSVGGVRIEDNVLVTEEGYENLTPAPKEVGEVLGIVGSG